MSAAQAVGLLAALALGAFLAIALPSEDANAPARTTMTTVTFLWMREQVLCQPVTDGLGARIAVWCDGVPYDRHGGTP